MGDGLGSASSAAHTHSFVGHVTVSESLRRLLCNEQAPRYTQKEPPPYAPTGEVLSFRED